MACKKHQKNPAKGYSQCEGCEVERLNRDLMALRADSGRLVWLMQNVSAEEWKRLGVTHDGGRTGRERIDAAML